MVSHTGILYQFLQLDALGICVNVKNHSNFDGYELNFKLSDSNLDSSKHFRVYNYGQHLQHMQHRVKQTNVRQTNAFLLQI